LARGPWHLGRYSAAINFAAILWVGFISIVLGSYDGFKPGRTIVALVALLALWYVVAERKRFRGPAWGEAAGAEDGLEPIPVRAGDQTRERSGR